MNDETHKTIRLKLVMRTEFYIDANVPMNADKWDVFETINDWEVLPHDLRNEDMFTVTHSHCSVDRVSHLGSFDPSSTELEQLAK